MWFHYSINAKTTEQSAFGLSSDKYEIRFDRKKARYQR